MDEAITVDDMIREFERFNFHHVNDTAPRKTLSYRYCTAVVNALIKLRKLQSSSPADAQPETGVAEPGKKE